MALGKVKVNIKTAQLSLENIAMKPFAEFCVDENLHTSYSLAEDFGRINIGKFLEPVMKRMGQLIGSDGVKAVLGVISGYKEKIKDYQTAKGDFMKALWSSKVKDGQEWITDEYEFWAGCLARACRENDPADVAKALSKI